MLLQHSNKRSPAKSANQEWIDAAQQTPIRIGRMNNMNNALPLAGKKGLITGIANDKSIAYAVAKAIVDLGGEIAVTYQNDKTAKYTQPLAEALGAKLFLKLDVAEEGSLEGVIAQC